MVDSCQGITINAGDLKCIYASLTCNSTLPQHISQSAYKTVQITGFKSLPGLPGVKGFIVAYTGCNPSLGNSHTHKNMQYTILMIGASTLKVGLHSTQLSMFRAISNLTENKAQN